MTKLDEMGLKAAHKRAHELGLDALADPWAPYLGSIVAAYLAATRTSDALRDLQRLGQECEQDRLAVVVNRWGQGYAHLFMGGSERVAFLGLEDRTAKDFEGPFRRQIVTIPGGLLRPEPVGEVSGTTEPA